MSGDSSSKRFVTKFRWPSNGDQLFARAADGFDDAMIASSWNRMAVITAGYKKAADLLVEQATQDRGSRDFLVYPIIFCYRQFLELSLKYIISRYGQSANVQLSDKDRHRFERLWPKFQQVVQYFDDREDDSALEAVGASIAEFARIDPASTAFRYSTDTNGQEIDLDMERVHLTQLRNTMDGIEGFLCGVDGLLHSLTRA